MYLSLGAVPALVLSRARRERHPDGRRRAGWSAGGRQGTRARRLGARRACRCRAGSSCRPTRSGPACAGDRRMLDACASDEEVVALIGSVQPSAPVRASLDQAFEALAGDGGLVAVRSSASDEDGAAHSFAGQLESFLQRARARSVATPSPRSGARASAVGSCSIAASTALRCRRRRPPCSCSAWSSARAPGVALQRGSRQRAPRHRRGERGAGSGHGARLRRSDADTWPSCDRAGAIIARPDAVPRRPWRRRGAHR